VRYPAEKPEMRAVLEWLVEELRAGRIIIPLTATNKFETQKINKVERRIDLAHIQATMSAGLFRGRYKRLEVELVDVIRSAYVLPKVEQEKNWLLSNVFFESFLEWGDPRFGQPKIPSYVSEAQLSSGSILRRSRMTPPLMVAR
jgi:hypothetical protein